MIINYSISTLVNTGQLTKHDLCSTIIGKITIPHSEEGLLAGEIRAYYLDNETAKQYQIDMKDLFEVGGQNYNDLLPYYHAIHIPTEELNLEEVTDPIERMILEDQDIYPELTEKSHGLNFLIIGEIWIHPAFDETKTRLTAIWETIQHFKHGCSLVLISPAPAHAEKLTPEELEAAINEQILQYRRMGFNGPIGENILYMDLDFTRPSAAEAGL